MEPATISTLTSWPAQALSQPQIEKIFREMRLTFGRRFAEQWAMSDADMLDLKMHWAEKLFGLTDKELWTGFHAIATMERPPTLSEFLKACRPPLDPLAAYHEAVQGMSARMHGEPGKWSHPAIFWAAVQVSSFDLLNQTYQAVRARWERALAEEMRKPRWAAIPEVAPAIGHVTQMTREQATQVLRELHATCVFKDAKGAKRTRWAESLLERVAAGDPTLHATITTIEFAKEALGLIPSKGVCK